MTVPIHIVNTFENHNLIEIPIIIRGEQINAILDSGAAISLMQESIADKLLLETESIEPLPLLFGDDSKGATNKKSVTQVSFEGIKNVMEIYIAPVLPCKLLLGLNFFRTFKLNLNFKRNSVEINSKDQFAEFCNIFDSANYDGSETKITLRSNSDILLAPSSETLVDLDDGHDMDGNIIIEMDESIKNKGGVFFCEALHTLEKGKCIVPLTNTNPYPVLINKGLKVAKNIDYNQKEADIFLVDDRKSQDSFHINEDLPPILRKQISDLLAEFKHVFAYSMDQLTQTNLYEHTIELIPGYKPFYFRPIRKSTYEENLEEKKLSEMKSANLIEPSVSPFGSRLLFIKKPGEKNEWRVVTDFRALNKITVRDVYLLPRTTTVLNELGGHKFYSTLDMFSGYFQIPLNPQSRPYTAFLTSNNLYQYKVLPMGCMNSGSAFSRLMALAFQQMKKDTITWYLDDIAVLGKSFEQHVENLRKVLSRLCEINLKLKPAKCFFALQKIKFLGYEIDESGIRPNMDKIKAILEMRLPRTGAETLSFLGCINFYRKHIQNFSIIAKPLYHLTKKDTKFEWTVECQTAFDHFKKVLTNPPILAIYDESLPIVLESDASKVGVGGIIAQVKDGKEVVIEYHSRCTNEHEKRYSATELELLGVIFIVSQARTYVFGRHFKIITDHSCLQYLQNLKSPFGRLARWYSYLAEFDFEVIHRSGKRNMNVDCLSRLPLDQTIPENQDTDLEERVIFFSQIPEKSAELILSTELIINSQTEDPFCSQIRNEMKNKTTGRSSTFFVKDGILMKRKIEREQVYELIVLPIGIKNQILRIFHDDSAHEMGLKTYLKMKSRFYHPHLFKIIDHYCRSCIKCQKRNPSTQLSTGSSDLMPTSHIPMEKISLDLMGPFPITSQNYRFILVVIDIATRFVIAKPIQNKTMGVVANCLLNEIFYTFGWPKVITSDRGKEFINSIFAELTNILRIDHSKTTSYHPNSNSIVERANRNVGIALAKRVNQHHDNWDNVLPAIIFGLNTSVHTITGHVPFTLMFNGRDISVATDMMFPSSNRNLDLHRKIIKELRESAERNVQVQQLKTMERRNQTLTDDQYKVGELCLVKKPLFQEGLSKKFMDRYTGPWEVMEVIKDGLFKLRLVEDRKKIQIVNLINLRRFVDREEFGELNKEELPAIGEAVETRTINKELTANDAEEIRIDFEKELPARDTEEILERNKMPAKEAEESNEDEEMNSANYNENEIELLTQITSNNHNLINLESDADEENDIVRGNRNGQSQSTEQNNDGTNVRNDNSTDSNESDEEQNSQNLDETLLLTESSNESSGDTSFETCASAHDEQLHETVSIETSDDNQMEEHEEQPVVPLRRSQRDRKPPSRFESAEF